MGEIQSAEQFKRLLESELASERWIASRGEASLEVWADIIARFPELRQWVAHNKTVPLEILDTLSRDRVTRVRYAVADRRKLSRELFDRLAADQEEIVRSAVASNQRTPKDVLEMLALDKAESVREMAKDRLRRSS